MAENEVNKVDEVNEVNKEGERRHHHHHHHHHHSHRNYLMEIDGERESNRSSSDKKKKDRKVMKKIDLSEKPFAVWIVIATFIIALLFLILMPSQVLLTNSHSISKWTAVSVCFSFTSIGSVLYLMRDKLTSRKTEGKVKKAIKGATLLVISSGIILLFYFSVSNVSIITRKSFDPDTGYITKAELKILLDEYNMSSGATGGTESDRIQLKVPERVNIAPEALNLALSDTSGGSLDNTFQNFIKSGTRLDVGYPVSIEFAVDQLLAEKISYITVEVSENEDFEDSRLFTLEADQRSCDVYHLKTGTKYYYRVSTFLSEEGNMNVRNRTGSFTVEDTPRILSIDGIRNVRDIGGWLKTEDGRSVKQGLLYRGTELDGMVKEEYSLTAIGKADMLDVLKIKSDFDLRAHNDSNPLGVNKKSFAIPAYEGIFKEAGKNNVRILFSELAKNTNYPVYMHCTYGCDRTGVMMFLLELILGVSEDNAIKEYEFSSMSISGITREYLFPVITGLEEYEGRSIQEKAESFLISCGVTPEEISAIREIFLQ
ncbi:MAG: tyrosine-protein phosphatase [Ruminococcaceae bacterium]|nr:tyrosine-protein phosphatase [Oscillospiraceae bacterium]